MTLFKEKAHLWWDEQGPFQLLHRMNPLRIQYILDKLHISNKTKILDIGCGGGLMSEPLARLGAEVTGIDLSEEAIEAAKAHAQEHQLAIDYRCEHLDKISNNSFDCVIVLEILEHVERPEEILTQAIKKLKKDGIIIVSTINKTLASYIKAIQIAEKFGFAPKGAHNWSAFIRPSQIMMCLESLGIKITDISGLEYSLFHKRWTLSKKIDTNYIVSGKMVGNTGIEPVTP